MPRKHLIFYDGTCGLCDHIVQFLLPRDQLACFLFAPLQGKTAEELLSPQLRIGDSLVLIENYDTSNSHIYVAGKGVFRILWILGRAWKILGIFFFIPAIFYDWAYRLVARHRHQLFDNQCVLPNPAYADRFLP